MLPASNPSSKPYPFRLLSDFPAAGKGSAATRTLQGVCMGWDAEKWVGYRQNKWQKVMKLSVEFYLVQLAAFAWILPPPLLCRAD